MRVAEGAKDQPKRDEGQPSMAASTSGGQSAGSEAGQAGAQQGEQMAASQDAAGAPPESEAGNETADTAMASFLAAHHPL